MVFGINRVLRVSLCALDELVRGKWTKTCARSENWSQKNVQQLNKTGTKSKSFSRIHKRQKRQEFELKTNLEIIQSQHASDETEQKRNWKKTVLGCIRKKA